MDKTTRYAALNTKVRALEGKLLKDGDYINLLSKNSVSEVAEYLKQNTYYRDIFADVDVKDIHRGRLEDLLKESHINGLEKIAHYFYDSYREFFKTLYVKYEIEDLKVILRSIKTGKDSIGANGSLKFIGKYSPVNIQALLASGSIDEFIKSLKGTIYYDYLRTFIGNNNDDGLFGIMMILDLAYFNTFYKNLRLVGKEDRDALKEIQGVNVDLLNLQWIYRGFKFYKLTPEELFNYTIAEGREFTRKDIKNLCYTGNLDEFQRRILNTRYSFLFKTGNTRDVFMERRILRYQYFYFKRKMMKESLSISQSIIYNLLHEFEVRDIISVIESIRYDMPADEAKKFLIREL